MNIAPIDRSLNMQGNDLSPLILRELCDGVKQNYGLVKLNLGSCGISSDSLSYLITGIHNHKTLQTVNLFNNQAFTLDIATDIHEFVYSSRNKIKLLKLTHCNLSQSSLNIIFSKLKYNNIRNIRLLALPIQSILLMFQ